MRIFTFFIGLCGILSLNAHCTETIIRNKCENGYKIDEVTVRLKEKSSDELLHQNLYKDLTDDYISTIKMDDLKKLYLGLLSVKYKHDNSVGLYFNYKEFKKLLHINTEKIRKLQDEGGGKLFIPFVISITMKKDNEKIIHDICFDKFYGDTPLLESDVNTNTVIVHEYGDDISRVIIKISDDSKMSSSKSSDD